jgi:hypothetical protein
MTIKTRASVDANLKVRTTKLAPNAPHYAGLAASGPKGPHYLNQCVGSAAQFTFFRSMPSFAISYNGDSSRRRFTVSTTRFAT